MESLDAVGKAAVRRQLFRRDTQPGAGNAGVVGVGLDGRILRIDPQAARKTAEEIWSLQRSISSILRSV